MDEILEKLNNEAQKISLNRDEKSSIRNILISYSRESPYGAFFSFSFIRSKRVLVPAFAIILLLLGGGTS